MSNLGNKKQNCDFCMFKILFWSIFSHSEEQQIQTAASCAERGVAEWRTHVTSAYAPV
jgi:hypothetical protein